MYRDTFFIQVRGVTPCITLYLRAPRQCDIACRTVPHLHQNRRRTILTNCHCRISENLLFTRELPLNLLQCHNKVSIRFAYASDSFQ